MWEAGRAGRGGRNEPEAHAVDGRICTKLRGRSRGSPLRPDLDRARTYSCFRTWPYGAAPAPNIFWCGPQTSFVGLARKLPNYIGTQWEQNRDGRGKRAARTGTPAPRAPHTLHNFSPPNGQA